MAAETGLGIVPVTGLRKHIPTRKMSITRHNTKSPAGLPQFEMVKPPSPTATIVVSVAEARPSTSESSRKTSDESSGDETSRTRPRRPTITIPAKVYAAEIARTESHPMPPPPSNRPPPRTSSRSPAEVPLPRSSTNTPTPVRTDSRATTAVQPEQTPVMRSVFPVYNPTVPLAQQPYYPNPELVPALTRMREVSGPTQKRHSIDKTHLAPATQETQKKESPLRRSESIKRPSGYSKPEELADLWSIANGQAAEDATDSYVLELSCDDLTLNSEIITFSSTSAPLYALSASPQNHISLQRIHPIDTRTRIPICSSTINRPNRHDPLIASIFPKLAGLLALDQSSTAACERRLDRQASALLQADAIKQAQEREASMLLWDADSNRFCLLHPTLLDHTATTLRIDITPTPTAPERITIFAPESTTTPLLSLEMSTLSLTIHGTAIAALPSLYLLDTLMTAMLTLLLHLHRLCADPSIRHSPPQSEENALYFPPPPPSLHSTNSRQNLRRERQRAGSRHSALRSGRSVKSQRSMTSMSAYGDKDKDIEMGVLDSDGKETSARGRWGFRTDGETKAEKIEKKKRPKGIVDVEDPALPKGTRAALRFLYWAFEVLYWVMGALIQVLAVGVVAVGKFVTKL